MKGRILINRTDKIFYLFGWILYGLLALLSIIQHTTAFLLTDMPGNCSFRHVTGLFCPGCGGTHAIQALANGNLRDSFRYHPLILYTAACFAIFLILNTAAFGIRKKFPDKNFFVHFHVHYVYVGIGIIFLQWILKLSGFWWQ